MIDLHYWPTPNGWKASLMLEELRGIVEAADAPGEDAPTVEDFPAARMEEADFNRLMARLGARSTARNAP